MRYPGSKWRIGKWIVSLMPEHHTYVEPYGGSFSVFFQKPPSESEYLNDIDHEIANLFRVLRNQPKELERTIRLTPWSRIEYEDSFHPTDDPVELARRTLIKHWMSQGGTANGRYRSGWRHNGALNGVGAGVTQQWRNLPERIMSAVERLKDAQIECRPALEVLGRLNHSGVLAYIDPPYLARTRRFKPMYRQEMLDDTQHIEMLEFLTQDYQGMVMLSAYESDLYDDLLEGWGKYHQVSQADRGGDRQEVLWLNPAAEANRKIGPHSLFALEAQHG